MSDIRTFLQSAVDLLGSQARLASAIGCSQQRVSQMLRSGGVSAELAVAIDSATKGQVARHDLRPDIFPLICAPRAEAIPHGLAPNSCAASTAAARKRGFHAR